MLSQGEIASEITVIDETLSAASMHNKVALTIEELKFL